MDEATYASIPEKLVLREIRFQVVEPGRRTRKLTIITTLTNPETYTAEDITKLYGYRWHAEIFFRFLKHVLGCRHLYSHDTAGIQIQAYCAIIACMLISLWTGRKPTQRTYEMICYYFLGLAEEDELPAHLAKLQRHEESQKT
jgi:IS4 transposase